MHFTNSYEEKSITIILVMNVMNVMIFGFYQIN